MTGTAAELTPLREVDDHPVGDGTPGPITREIQERLRGRAARPRGALRPLERRGAGAGTGAVSRIQIYDTTLRDGMQGEGMSLSAEEKVRVAHLLDELGIAFIEAGFPASNPKEEELFERLAHERLHADVCAFGMTRRRDVRADGGPRAAPARLLLRPGLHAGRQDLVAAPREGRARRARGEPGDDRRLRRLPAWRRASA